MRVLLVRHGETVHNKENTITGQMDISLNETGKRQAAKAAERLEDAPFTAAYASDLQRSYETAKTIAEKHGLDPERCKEFRERAFGKYEGKPKDTWREITRNHEGERHHLRPEGGESLKDVGERFMRKLNELQNEHSKDDTILVGGHGVALKAAFMEILGLTGDDYTKLSQDNTGLTELEHDKEHGWKILRMNDTAHLSG